MPSTVIAEFSLDVLCRYHSDRSINPTASKRDLETHRPPTQSWNRARDYYALSPE